LDDRIKSGRSEKPLPLQPNVEGLTKENTMKTQTAPNQSETTASAQNTASNREFIQRRAYEIYVRRGQSPGHELEDWLQAEREVKTTATQHINA
jgi:hypothetical protein